MGSMEAGWFWKIVLSWDKGWVFILVCQPVTGCGQGRRCELRQENVFLSNSKEG